MILKDRTKRRRQRRAIADNNCDAVIFIGDSRTNGANTEPVGMDSKYTGNKENVLIYYKPDRSATNDGAWETYNPHLNHAPGYPRPSAPWPCGPLYGFGWRVNILVQRTIAILKVGLGGSGILQVTGDDNDWWIPSTNQPATNDLWYEFYFNFLDLAWRYIDIIKLKKNTRLRAVFVSLGTNDVQTSRWNATNWRAGVLRLIDYMRAQYPSVPIYWEGPRPDLYLAPSGIYPQANVDACNAILDDIVNPVHGDYRAGVVKQDYNSLALNADGVHNTADADFAKGEANADIFLSLL